MSIGHKQYSRARSDAQRLNRVLVGEQLQNTAVTCALSSCSQTSIQENTTNVLNGIKNSTPGKMEQGGVQLTVVAENTKA